MKKLALIALLLVGCGDKPESPGKYNRGDIIKFKDTGKLGILEEHFGRDMWHVNYGDDFGDRHYITLSEWQFSPASPEDKSEK